MHSTHLSEINTELSVDESTLEKKVQPVEKRF